MAGRPRDAIAGQGPDGNRWPRHWPPATGRYNFLPDRVRAADQISGVQRSTIDVEAASPHILVVDDHRDIRETLAKYLGRHGYRVSTAEDARAARRVLQTAAIDLVVLDIMMPGEDGLSLCRDLRARSSIPIVLLTAMAEDTDRIVGLELGADDYVTKPFSPRELLARIKAVLRRANSLPPAAERLERQRFRFGDWVFDPLRRELFDERRGVLVPLGTAESQLLAALVRHAGLVLSREQLLDLARGREAQLFDRSIDNLVSRLRRKLGDHPKRPRYIATHWGGGYSFVARVEPA